MPIFPRRSGGGAGNRKRIEHVGDRRLFEPSAIAAESQEIRAECSASVPTTIVDRDAPKATEGTESPRPEPVGPSPRMVTTDDAIRVAAKAAIDEGDTQRAMELLALLRHRDVKPENGSGNGSTNSPPNGSADVIDLKERRRGAR